MKEHLARATSVEPVETLACSVVIPTFHRDETLLRLLEAIARQDLPIQTFEVIVVDDACSQSTPSIVARVTKSHPQMSLRVLPGQSRGPATARNIGWRAARGAVIAFIDDDAYPAGNGWLREGLNAMADPAIAGASGKVRVPAATPPTDFQRNVKHLERGSFLTCNAFYRRTWLERVGGFDERFRVPYREDSDLQFRVEAAGGRLIQAEGPLVIHPAPPGRFGISLRLQRYSMYNALLYKKHPLRYRSELQRYPPFHYYAIIGFAATAILALLARHRRAALAAAMLWTWLEGRFFLRRACGVSHRPRHLLDLALTSLLIPPLSVYWRLRGAFRYRVFFF